jgi:hypothetical protein
MGKVVGFVSANAPAMAGKKNGVAAKLKKNKVREFKGSTSLTSTACFIKRKYVLQV